MRIRSFGHALPKRQVTNSELTQFLDTSDEWIRSHTGIESRHILSDGETLSSLGAQAAQMALQNGGLTADDLDFIFCPTTCGEMLFPATGCLIQQKIGAKCPAMDLNAGCTGFLYALDLADAMLARGGIRRILIVSAEQITKLPDWSDRGTCVLFGDAAGAVVCEAGEGFKAIRLTAKGTPDPLYGVGDGGNCPFTERRTKPVPLQMNGQEVFKFAVTQSCEDILAVLEQGGVSPDLVDTYVLHQANRRIIDAARTRLKQPAAKFPINITTHGNTGSAGIPVLLSEMAEDGRLKTGQTLVLSAFGAGLTSGAALLNYNV